LITTVAAVLTLSFGSGASANETTRLFGSSSWQFKTPAERFADDEQLILRCNREGDFHCFDNGQSSPSTATGVSAATIGQTGSGSGSYSGYSGTAGAIANQISITVTGDGNSVTTDSTQSNSGDGIEHACTNCDVSQ
jgi:hypothetical protein